MHEFKIDFIGIGANKAGTSWLNKMLDAHPQICMAEPKEVHFFHDTYSYTRKNHQGNFAKGLSWYKRFFQHCSEGNLKGEITPKYLIDPVVPQRIHQLFPGVKLILCMRSPVERVTSQYYFERYFNKRETRPLSVAIREEPELISNGLYYQGIQQYLAYFPLSSLHFVWFEDIRLCPEKVLAEVYTFLGVDATYVPSNLHEKSNAAKKAKSKWVRDNVAWIERKLSEVGMSGFVRWLKKMKLNALIAYFNSQPITYDQVNEVDKQWLLAQYREDILQLQALTGRDLSSWLK